MTDDNPELRELINLPDTQSISRLDLLELPGIRNKDTETIGRLLRQINSIEETTNISLGNTPKEKLQKVEQEELGFNNSSFLIRNGEGIQLAKIKLYNSTQLSDGSTRCERESTALVELAKHLSARTSVPEWISVDLDDQALVMSHEFANLSTKGEGFLMSILDAIEDFKQVEITKEEFPFKNNLENSTPADYVQLAKSRLQKFRDWAKGLEEIDEANGYSPTEISDYKTLGNSISEMRILEKIEVALEKVDGLSESGFFNLPTPDKHQSPTPSDGSMDNFIYRKLQNGQTNIVVVDHEYFSTNTDRLFFVAMLMHNPSNRRYFNTDSEMQESMEKFLYEYAKQDDLDTESIDRLNKLLPVAKLAWIASYAIRYTSSKNYGELSGETNRTYAEYLNASELPVLNKLLDADGFVYQVDTNKSVQKLTRKSDQKQLTSPLTGENPITGHERRVAEIVEDGDKWIDDINQKLKEADLYEFSKEEIFDNPPYLLGKTLSVENLGNGIYLVLSEYFMPGSDRKEPLVRSWITKDKKTSEAENGLFFITDDQANVDLKELEGEEATQFYIDPKLVDDLIGRSSYPDRFQHIGRSLKKFKDNVPGAKVVTEIRLTETTNETHGSHESIYTLVTSGGEEFPYVANRMGVQGAEGSGFMNITEEGLWRMELNTRMFTLPKKNQKGGRNENVESGRRYDLSLKGLAEELHLKSDEIQIAGSTLLACDISTEANTIFSLLLKTKIGNEHGVKDDEPQDLVINSGPQEIRFVDLKGSEIIELIKRGVIRDEATISMVAAFLSKYTKEISFKEEFASKVLYMKEVIAPHDGGKKKRLTMLNGSINSGEQVSIFQQNSGTWRSDYTVNNSTLKEYKQNRKSNERIVAKNMKELFEGFGLGKYDLTTTAAVFVGMLQADMIDINEIDLKNWPPKTAVPDIP